MRCQLRVWCPILCICLPHRLHAEDMLVAGMFLQASLDSPTLIRNCLVHPQEVVVLETKSARAATTEILEAHSIPAAVSKDLSDLLPDAAPQPAPVPTPATVAEQ